MKKAGRISPPFHNQRFYFFELGAFLVVVAGSFFSLVAPFGCFATTMLENLL
jgi:hypothetical protein